MKFKDYFDIGKVVKINRDENDAENQLKNCVTFYSDFSKVDGYVLTISDKAQIVIRYNGRGKDYSVRTLKNLAKAENNQIVLPVCRIEDYPDFELRGIIEGFYGSPYSTDARLDLIDFCSLMRMNCYFYAPKDDLYHREKWREDYPEKEKQALHYLIKYSQKKDIDFYYCISPGKDFAYSNECDYDLLEKKLNGLAILGITKFALLLDDIDYSLNEETKQRFKTPAEAHAYLSNYLARKLKLTAPLIVCPTEYMQNFDTPYRKSLRELLDKNIRVIWTGYNTVAEVITADEGEEVKSIFGGRELVLWDNYPVNDFLPKRRMYFSAIKNRSRFLKDYHNGMIANPMENWYSSKFALYSMAQYMWDSATYDYNKAEKEACEMLAENAADEMLFFIELNRDSVMYHYDNKSLMDAYKQKNFDFLDKHYLTVRRAMNTLTEKLPKMLLSELHPLIHYALVEADAFESFRKGNLTEKHINLLINSKYRLADQSFLQFIKDNFPQFSQIIIEPRREVWWKI